jgi:hypothetical protein
MRDANPLPQQVAGLIVRLKGEKPHWDARNIGELLVRRLDGDVRVPAKSTIHQEHHPSRAPSIKSTIHAVLDRHGRVKRMGRTRSRAGKRCKR